VPALPSNPGTLTPNLPTLRPTPPTGLRPTFPPRGGLTETGASATAGLAALGALGAAAAVLVLRRRTVEA